ncbi:putative mitochondrial genome maintenance protein mgm101 protein [Phaeoacremonium minimum UCRPA7]|uniref:Mitochondrial genome maintenance protein MGM101 n=1 Tax=Phaeoacremonium minimum (strain UCR-PA7) TaxID=1286976 RepID=R8BVP4_PHAM7|nr:putative mitochondrial genome maintenance protein mgm101 protein [Phaeoacremonium minimum UCRPA7]EOO03349.1 putative mitochondrial genome maintenance protein mgm101 protein [Phaeoacremonium minimum UCRPA7]
MRSSLFQALRPVRLGSQSLRCVSIASPQSSYGLAATSIATISTSQTTRRPPPPTQTPAARAAASSTPARTSQRKPQPAATPTAKVSEHVASSPFLDPISGPDSALGGSSGNGNGNGTGEAIDWSRSFHGLSTESFPPDVAAVLMKPIEFDDVEIKPDGIIYLPEIKYRRILNNAFGPGGWGMAPRGELFVGDRVVTREYALVVHGRFVAQARGEMQYFSEDTIATAGEGCKSNALMRCSKDLGIASELWDPRYIREFKKKHAREIWVEHVVNKKKRQIWVRKDEEPAYPYKKS